MLRCGTVLDVRDGQARIRISEAAASEACKSCGGRCGRSSGFETTAPAPDGLQAGDEVRVEIKLPDPVLSAVMLFLVPLVLVMGGLGLWQWLGPAGADQAKGLLLGLGLMVLWYAGVAGYDRVLRRRPRHRPRVVQWSRP